MKRKLTFLFIYLFSMSIFSQNFKLALETTKLENQKCIDKGQSINDCAVRYYQKSDSILNVVYRYIRKNMNSLEKESLKQVQLKWLKERNQKFQEIDTENPELENNFAIRKQKKTKIVNQRILELIEKFIPTQKSTSIDVKTISNTLNNEYLHTICKHLKINKEDISIDKSSSLNYNSDNIFYVITYKSEKNTEYGNLFETAFLMIDKNKTKVIHKLKYNEVSYYDDEALQTGKVNILKSLVNIGANNKTIALTYENSVGNCANSYFSNNLILITPLNRSFIENLEPFHFHRAKYEGNCNGNSSREEQKSSIQIQENGKVLILKTNVDYEEEVNDERSEKKSKEILRTIKLNTENKYEIEELPYYFFN